jgi:hypothetical protein
MQKGQKKIVVLDKNDGPRVSIQITEINYDRQRKRLRTPIAHLTIYNVDGNTAKKIIDSAFKKEAD